MGDRSCNNALLQCKRDLFINGGQSCLSTKDLTRSTFYRSITLLKNLASIAIDIEGDEFGKIFEYFLGKFDFVMSNFPAANN